MQYLSEIWMVHVPSIYVVISFSQTNIFELALIDFLGKTLSYQLFLVYSLADDILMAWESFFLFLTLGVPIFIQVLNDIIFIESNYFGGSFI